MQSYARQELFGLQSSMGILGFPPKEDEASNTDAIGAPSSWRGYYDPDWVQQQQQQFQPSLSNQLSLSLFDANPRTSEVERGDWFITQHYEEVRKSRYLVPAQELLNELCSIESSRRKSKRWEEGGGASSSAWNQPTMDVVELQRRKARLLFLLEEVDRRYRRYCEQMRAVVAAFEAVAGEGAAAVYAAMAKKAMSRHFRCLRDGIVAQAKATRKAMGEKEGPGMTRGETPRLKVLDQCLRHQKLLQQGAAAAAADTHPWRPQRGLPERSVSLLRAWLFEHFLHPYPSDVDKHILARQTGLTRSQVSNWFINARVRLWKPMVEEMYLEETKEEEDHNPSSATSTNHPDFLLSPTNPNPNLTPSVPMDDRKPESDSLSSVVIGATSLDVRSLHDAIPTPTHHQHLAGVHFPSYSGSGHFHNSVSLTLGLQQHDGGARGLSYPPAAVSVASPGQGSLFFGREPVQFTVLDGDAQNMSLPYKNLMEARLLHDLAG